MADWAEFAVLEPRDLDPPVSFGATFDPFHELIWTYADQGRVTSFTAPTFDRYTAFRTADPEIRQLIFDRDAVIAVCAQSLVITSREGLPKHQWIASENYDLICAAPTGSGSSFYVGGHQQSLLVFDTQRAKIIKETDIDSPVAIMRRSGRLLFTASPDGFVSFRDPTSFKAETTIEAHSGTIADMDISGNLLVTCGFSERQGDYIADPLVKVYDIRTFRALPPISFQSSPAFVRFHPKFSSTVFMVSQTGGFQVAEVGNSSSTSFYQLETSGTFCSSMDVSSSGEMMLITDFSGTTHVWSPQADPVMNFYSEPIEPIPPPPSFPDFDINDQMPLNVIGMPFYDTELFSVYPNRLSFKLGEPPRVIDRAVLSQVKQLDFVGYAPNPGTTFRNQIPTKKTSSLADLDRPKFRSEKERELSKTSPFLPSEASSSSPQPRAVSSTDDLLDNHSQTIPKHYRHVEIKYSKLGVDDFDFAFFNKTKFSGLETHIHNSYANSLLQMLYYLPPMRQLMVNHVVNVHSKEFCLACELGFLFRMLDGSEGFNCHASNFLQAFSTIPQAAALGLFEPEDPTPQTSYMHLIQNLTRYLLQHLQQETSEDTKQSPSGSIDALFALGLSVVDHCMTCHHELKREAVAYVLEMVRKAEAGGGSVDFATMLSASLRREMTTKAWCESCNRYVPTTQTKTAQRLPAFLCVNVTSPALSPEEEILAKKARIAGHHDGFRLPQKFSVESDQSRFNVTPTYVPEKSSNDDDTKLEDAESNDYILVAFLAQIQNDIDRPHLVAHIKVGREYHQRHGTLEGLSGGLGWYMFNDFLVTPLSTAEAIQLRPWKLPSVLCYVRSDVWAKLNDVQNVPEPSRPLDPRFLLLPQLSTRRTRINAIVPLTENDVLNDKFICAIDAEFVTTKAEENEIRSNGTRSVLRPPRLSLARVSVVRGLEGPLVGVPFIDDYIATTAPIIDYLTKFSGIKVGDLDPMTSPYTLTTLKNSYRKLRILVDCGVIFVGHGLQQDFRIINIRVPSSQVIDTVELFHRQGQRKISLKFLASYFLKKDIQVETHSSVEDSQTALAIYRKYELLKQQGKFEETLDEIYEAGRLINWVATPLS